MPCPAGPRHCPQSAACTRPPNATPAVRNAARTRMIWPSGRIAFVTMPSARRTSLALLLLLLAAALAAALLLKHYGVGTPADAICGAGANGCDVVNQSVYAKLGGVPLAA